MITIVNYGLGNISAFSNMYKRMNIAVKVASQASDLNDATHIILPGVGAFDHAMELLDGSGMRAPLDELVLQRQIPVLGICVGMQILARSSEEGSTTGLGWIKGQVRSFASNPTSAKLAMPHMGWNDVTPTSCMKLFKGIEENARFYFLHSYYFECNDAEDIAATANYGFEFPCTVKRNNIYGVQFHPEKSHRWGATLLKNFAEI